MSSTSKQIANLQSNINANNNALNNLISSNKSYISKQASLNQQLLKTTDSKQQKVLHTQLQITRDLIKTSSANITNVQTKLAAQKDALNKLLASSKEHFGTPLRAPRPNVGTCSKTGRWTNQNMVGDCVNCVTTPGWYGEKMFYCAGKCM